MSKQMTPRRKGWKAAITAEQKLKKSRTANLWELCARSTSDRAQFQAKNVADDRELFSARHRVARVGAAVRQKLLIR
jgi:hypothetical protein